MNILFLTQILPYPPDSGPKVKTWNVLRYLSQCGHHVTLASFVRPEEVSQVPFLKEICSAFYMVPMHRSRIANVGYMMKSYLTGRPFLIERDDLRSMQKLVDKLVTDGHFDFVHADQLTMVQFALRGASASEGENPRVIFDAHNAVWTIVERMRENAQWFLRPILSVEARRVKSYEGKLLKKVDQVLAVTDVDRDELEEALKFSNDSVDNHVAPITVIPIAVDTKQLKPIKLRTGSRNIVTLGTLHYPPNADGIRWFFNEVFPLICQSIPDANLTIIGKNPPSDFLDLAAQNPRTIKVTGYVPDLVPYFEESSLMVIPVRAGGGMRVRILEAFAYAMPVVTTTVGLEGIQAQPGEDVLVADKAEDFAASVIRLLNDPALREQLSVNGRHLVERKYDWQVTLKDMEKIYQKVE
jgi:glycosyltransferase involved in cell wall biosynthesis